MSLLTFACISPAIVETIFCEKKCVLGLFKFCDPCSYSGSSGVIEYYCFFKSSSTSCFVILVQVSGISPLSANFFWYFSSRFDLKWQTNHFQYGWVDVSGVMLHVAYSPPASRYFLYGNLRPSLKTKKHSLATELVQ